ncbi:MAG: Na(+)/H(+) antiporter subunit G1 [Gammaproteobacteria bacterium]|nr:Na(+)/H(+) antiporter subunit G1 [Gammaproteobacteria bacterium]
MILNMLSWVLSITGSALVVIGGIGLIRLPDFFSRLHAAGIIETLGAALIIAGLMMQAGLTLVALKLLLILMFLLFTGPTATHTLAKAALHGRLTPRVHAPGNGKPETKP